MYDCVWKQTLPLFRLLAYVKYRKRNRGFPTETESLEGNEVSILVVGKKTDSTVGHEFARGDSFSSPGPLGKV